MTARLVTTDEAAAALGVPAATIRSWRHRHHITPAGMLPGRGRGGMIPLYVLDEVRRYAEQRPTRPAGA